MAHSKISICNLALAALGADPIRAFDENNKRARMCDVFYDMSRDLLLAKFDWPFARVYASLNQVDTTSMTVPDNQYVWQLPVDCMTPRTIQQLGSKDRWRVMGDKIYCDLSDEVYLYYTKKITNPSLFTDTYVALLTLRLAVSMGPAITSDKKLVELLQTQYSIAQAESWESDANIGNDYRAYDEDPENDTFVSADGYVNPDPNAGRTWPS